MPQRILVALDDSIRAPGVLDAGAEVARKFGAEVYLLRTVVLPPEFPAAAASSGPDMLPEHLTNGATRDLLELAKRAPEMAVKIVVAFGSPAQTILETAHKLDVDLIVLGSHGYRGWDRFLGTTAASVANLSDRNVLIVHERRPDVDPTR